MWVTHLIIEERGWVSLTTPSLLAMSPGGGWTLAGVKTVKGGGYLPETTTDGGCLPSVVVVLMVRGSGGDQHTDDERRAPII